MINCLKIKPIHELPCRFEKINDKWHVIDEGIYIVDGELCCTQDTYDTLLNNPEERENFNIFAKDFLMKCKAQELMCDYLSCAPIEIEEEK